jgi:hypothetical protein
MASRQTLDVSRIVVVPGRIDQRAYWEFRKQMFRGTIYHYAAMDANLPSRVPWWFTVNVPKTIKKGGYVLLQALDYPRMEAWAPIPRTVINFAKATMTAYRGMLYAKIRLADPMSAQKYENTKWGHRKALPAYFGPFTLRPKRKVATSRASDGDTLVAAMRRDDHAQMVRLFFATKVWPLRVGLPTSTRKALARDAAAR